LFLLARGLALATAWFPIAHVLACYFLFPALYSPWLILRISGHRLHK
jgi:hypothetical protein